MDVRGERLRRVRLSFLPRAEAFLITCPENRRYLSGFSAEDVSLTESAGALLLTRKEAFLLTDPRYQEEAKVGQPFFEPRIYQKGLTAELKELLPLLGVKVLLVEPRYVSLSFCQALRRKLPWLEIKEAPPIVERLRERKDEAEVKLLKTSLVIAEKIMLEVSRQLRPGVSEKELCAQIIALSYQWAEGPSFPPIVASGPNAAKPHAEPTARKLRKGEPLLIDMGVKYRGYCSDITRTFCVGEPDERFVKIYRLVLAAKEAAEKKLAAGVPAREVDLAARAIFRKEGLERHFWHALGHGVGLAIHEAPALSYRSRKRLKPGHVVTVEPGLYFPDWGGVRLEDMVLVGEEGLLRLNTLGFLEL